MDRLSAQLTTTAAVLTDRVQALASDESGESPTSTAVVIAGAVTAATVLVGLITAAVKKYANF